MIKLKNSNCDKTPNSKSAETQKLKFWWHSKNHIVMKLKNSNYDETQNSNCDETHSSNCYETQKLKLWWNSNCD